MEPQIRHYFEQLFFQNSNLEVTLQVHHRLRELFEFANIQTHIYLSQFGSCYSNLPNFIRGKIIEKVNTTLKLCRYMSRTLIFAVNIRRCKRAAVLKSTAYCIKILEISGVCTLPRTFRKDFTVIKQLHSAQHMLFEINLVLKIFTIVARIFSLFSNWIK